MSGYVYTLLLEGGKYYVGWSSDPCSRIAQHFLARGAQWTRTHKPQAVLCIQEGDTQLERAVTIARMCQHGWQNVRGGPWLAPTLLYPPPPITNALLHRPPPPLPQVHSIVELRGHSVALQRFPGRWRARVFGAKATTACPKRGFKELRGESREAVLALADGWLATAGAAGEVEDEEGGEPEERGEGGFASDSPNDFPSESVGESDGVRAAMALMDSLAFG
jgi:predicted GIY-YIG superfamily endonuclease